jgi:hypothetical protein
MITNDGKELIGKYLLGQAPAYATHIAIGCGAQPLAPTDPLPLNLEQKTLLDCEMARVPIISKGFVDDDGVTKITFSAELPAENRYDITEIGLWSAGGNNLAPNSDSKIIFNFSESWESHNTSISAIPAEDSNLGTTPDFDISTPIFTLSTSNPVLRGNDRLLRNEGPRFLNRKIFIRGDQAEITESGTQWTATGTHIHLNSVNFSISNNGPEDILKLAFSVMDKTGSGSGTPDQVRVLMEFYKNEITTEQAYAKAKIEFNAAELSDRYLVAEIPIQDLETAPDFSASEIRTCRIFVSVLVDDGLGNLEPSDNHYVVPDVFRIDNVTTQNPLYKMVGYGIANVDGNPIVKLQNTNNYVEFRLSLGLI